MITVSSLLKKFDEQPKAHDCSDLADYNKKLEDFVADIKKSLTALDDALKQKLENNQGIVTLNDDGSTKDVLIGIRELRG